MSQPLPRKVAQPQASCLIGTGFCSSACFLKAILAPYPWRWCFCKHAESFHVDQTRPFAAPKGISPPPSLERPVFWLCVSPARLTRSRDAFAVNFLVVLAETERASFDPYVSFPLLILSHTTIVITTSVLVDSAFMFGKFFRPFSYGDFGD